MANLSSHPLTVAQHAFDAFSSGAATGDWATFLDLLTDDFRFWFPIGPFRGWNEGKPKAVEFFQRVSTVFDEGLSLQIERITCNDVTVVFEVRSHGLMLGYPYENQAAISFDIREDKVCAYREYLGVLYQLNG